MKAIGGNVDKKYPEDHALIVAINEPNNPLKYPSEVKFTIRQDHQRDYVDAAQFINYSDADVCILEHEFGIFGGDMGVFILPFLHRLELPLIVTFHTVLKNPNNIQMTIVKKIAERAAKIVLMSHRAITMLQEIYGVDPERMIYIPHGVPSIDIASANVIRKKFNFMDRKVLFTFGLLSRNKGIETVINALPQVVAKHPSLLYIILGNTHPGVLKHSGEEYRNYLIKLAKRYNIEDNVYFQKQFVDEKTLFEYLTAVDIYITPYLNEEQITSGTLSYAVGAGAVVLSTPYWHAQELLADGRGCLFDFRNSSQLAKLLNDLLDNTKRMKELKQKSYEYGKSLRWPLVGKQYLTLAKETLAEDHRKVETKPIIDPTLLPSLSLAHVKRLSDDTGIVQHAVYGIPNLKEGYCLDDNARALIMALMAYRQTGDPLAYEYLPIYLSFIHYMQTDKGTFRNFLSFSRQFLDNEGSEDSFGRTVWALGYLISNSPKDSFYQFARDLFGKAKSNFGNLEHLRGIANTIIGICHYLQKLPDDEEVLDSLRHLTTRMKEHYHRNSSEDWHWFENVITYDNGILPLALFHSAGITHDKQTLEIAVKTTAFLESITLKRGYLTPIGSDGWYPKGGKCSFYAQQSIDVMAMVLLFYQGYHATKDRSYIEKMFTSFLWYLGENELWLPLYDYETKGCCDGLEAYGLNKNQGAESTLAYLISHLTILASMKHEHEYVSKQKGDLQ